MYILIVVKFVWEPLYRRVVIVSHIGYIYRYIYIYIIYNNHRISDYIIQYRYILSIKEVAKPPHHTIIYYKVILAMYIHVCVCVCVCVWFRSPIQFGRVRSSQVVTGRCIYYNGRDQVSSIWWTGNRKDFTGLRTVLVITAVSVRSFSTHRVAYYDIPIPIYISVYVCVCLSTLFPRDEVAVQQLSSDIR
jgi:hypothetical protein